MMHQRSQKKVSTVGSILIGRRGGIGAILYTYLCVSNRGYLDITKERPEDNYSRDFILPLLTLQKLGESGD